MSWFVFVVRLSDRYTRDDRDRIIQGLHRHDVGAAPYFPCIHLQPFYQSEHGYRPGMLPITEAISASTIALPFFPQMCREQVDRVTAELAAAIGKQRG